MPCRSDAKTGRELMALWQPIKTVPAHILPQPLRKDMRTGGVAIWQQIGKLLAAEPTTDVDLAHRIVQQMAECLENRIASRMPEGVVDGLEVVDVDQDQADRPVARVGKKFMRGLFGILVL